MRQYNLAHPDQNKPAPAGREQATKEPAPSGQAFLFTSNRAAFMSPDHSVDLGEVFSEQAVRSKMRGLKVTLAEEEGVATIKAVTSDGISGIDVYGAAGHVSWIASFGNASNTSGVRTGQTISQVSEAMPKMCKLNYLNEDYVCKTNGSFTYFVSPSTCGMQASQLPESLDAFKDCLVIESIAIGNVTE